MRTRLPLLSCLLLLPALLSCGEPPQPPDREAEERAGGLADPDAAAASITAQEIHDLIGVMAHDSVGGRDTPSPGLEMTAAWAAERFAELELEPGGDDGTFIQRYDWTRRFPGSEEISTVSVPNVVGLLFGSDPVLREEWVVFTAHFDHVSGAPNESGDSIYNGADDNASGTAAIMEVAEAFSMMSTPPRRSLAFVLVSGEEKGLLGAAHFARGASIPTEAQVADINADMVSMNWPDSIFVFGREYTTLGPTLDRVIQDHPEVGIAVMESRWPQIPLFQMSDHAAFVREEIPGIFFFSGLHQNLHRPSDELGAIDADKAARVARLIFYLGYQVAQDEEPPQWTEAGREMLAEMGGAPR